MKATLIHLGWAIMAFFATFLFITTATYLSGRPDLNFLLVKGDLVFDAFWRSSFYIHITGGMLCLLIGPFQFLPWLRKRSQKLHRNLGKVYLVGILVLGGPAGLYMSFFAEGGWLASIGFLLLSLGWMTSAFRAYEEIRKGNVGGHVRWMVRSYAFTFAAVTLRIWVPVCTLVMGIDPEVTVVLTAWLSWVPNVLAGELILRMQDKRIVAL